MINEQSIGLKFQNSVTGQKKLEEYEKTLSNIQKLLKNMPQNIKIGNFDKSISDTNKLLANVDKNISDIGNQIKGLNKDVDGTSDKFKKAFTVGSIISVSKALSEVWKWISKNSKSSATFIENMNLLDVAYNNNTVSAEKLVNRMTEMYGLDESWGYRTVGMFKQLSNAMGLADEVGTKLSNTLTLLSIDLSSLYNTSTTDSVQKLASALAGQTKPIRSFGADITETTLSQTLLNNNIDLMVRNLSFAEKRLLIVTTILQQTIEAQNDWARTIESVANQERILEEQQSRLNRALGNVFLPILKNILPYLNAIMMVAVELINWFAVLIGYNEEDFDFFGETDVSINDLIDSIGTAEEGTQKLKRSLRGFDKLNNITTPTATTSAGGGLGVSPDIMNLFNKTADDYLSKLTDVEMKATRIRDKIMKWLGFTKQVDTATGKISFKFDHITGGTVLGALVVGGAIFKGVKGIFTFFNGIKKVFAGKGIVEGVTKLSTFATLWSKIRLGVGLGGLAISFGGAYDSMYSLVDKTKEADKAYKELAISMLGAVSSGALLGSKFGIVGTAIGVVGGAIVGLTGALGGYISKTNEIEVANRVFDGQGIAIETLGQKYRNMFADADVWNENLTLLKNNYEQTTTNVTNAQNELDLFVRQLKNQDQAISETQLEELNTKYDNLKESTDDAINSTIEYETALIKAYNKTSAESTASTAEQIANLTALRLKQKGYEDEYIEALRKIDIERFTSGKSQEWYNQKVNELNIAFGKAPDTLSNATGAVDIFNNKLDEIDYGNIETLNDEVTKTSEAYNKTIDTLNTRKKDVMSYYDEQIEKQNKIKENFEATALIRELTPEEKERYQTAIDTISELENKQTTAVNNIDSTINKIQGSYKGFLATVYADLVKNGADTSKDFSGTISTIETDLNKLKDVDMSDFGKNLFDRMIKSITENEDLNLSKINKKFNNYGISAGDEFYDALEKQLTNSEKIANIHGEVTKEGGFIVEGYRNGIDDEIRKNGVGDIGEKSCKETKKQLGINSPSTVYKEIGINTMLGYINGIEEKQSELLNTIERMLKKVKNKFENITFKLNISTSVENSFNSILYKLELFTNRFRNGINNLMASMTTSMNNITVGSDNKLQYNAMPYIYIPRFKEGLDYVPNDYYLAYLDEGERVLTKQENKDYSNNMTKNNAKNSPTILNIYLDGENQVATYVLDKLLDKAKDDGKPITIGG